MNKFKFYFILFSFTFVLFSCDKSSSDSTIPIRDFAVQYAADIAIIEDYLNTHYLVVDDNQDVTISKITETDVHPSMMTLLNSETFPKLLVKEVALDDITYEIYYIKLKADNVDGIAPTRVDGVFCSYKGSYLYYKTTQELVVDKNGNPVLGPDNVQLTTDVTTLNTSQFTNVLFPEDYIRLDGTIRGWTEIFPLFKTGNKHVVSGEPISFTEFGAGIIFIPSGLGYYNIVRPGIPSYSPLVYSFKLNEVKFLDQDQDGILSNNEDLIGDLDFTNDDTDGDGIQNLYDVEDDGDGYFTLTEIKRPDIIINGVKTSNGYYPYNGAAIDDPATLYIDERQGIPRKFTGPIDEVTGLPTPLESDFTDPTRLRRHLDPTCFPPYQ